MSSSTPPFEPFRAKAVEPIRPSTSAERRRLLEASGFNLFRVPAALVNVDLLTDSGTGPMSAAQWSAMMRGDDSYAGSASYFRLVEALSHITGYSNVLPVHQGRVAERLLVETVIGGAGHAHAGEYRAGAGLIVPNNAHFDTTRHMIEESGAKAVNLLVRGGDDPDLDAPFKGDMDVAALQELLQARGDDVPFVMLTVTCNSNGGQGVSLANMREVRSLCNRYRKMLVLDACRFAENAWFIKQREQGQAARSVREIVRDMFDLSDGVAMSTRKDGLCNVGGLLLLREDNLHRRACRLCVLTEGFQMTYGSLPGRDLEAIAVGMAEVMDENYLAQRSAMIERLARQLQEGGVKTVRPAGGHAVFIDTQDFLQPSGGADGRGSDLLHHAGPQRAAPGAVAHTLACALYEHAGVRCAAIGTVLRQGDRPMELLRLAIPRRLHTQSQLDYVAKSIIALKHTAATIQPRPLPHDLDPLAPGAPPPRHGGRVAAVKR